MQIPETIHIPKDQTTLLMITSKQEAILHKIDQGELTHITSIKVDKPHYSDNEGHHEARSDGKLMRSGSERELKDETILTDFVHELNDYIEKHLDIDTFSQIYLTVPEHLKNTLPEALPKNVSDKIARTIYGNFTNEETVEVLQRFFNEDSDTDEIDPSINKEAKKLLKSRWKR